MKSKAQAALEFLTTYAWAFLVILITLGALYYFGVFEFSKFLPQRCLFSSQFECIDFSFVGSEIRFRLVNNIGEDITITTIGVTNDASNPLTCTSPSVPFEWQREAEIDFVFTNCQNGAFLPEERAEARITMLYYAINTPSKPIHKINGRITATVNEP